MSKIFNNPRLIPQAVLATLITIFFVAGVSSATTIGTNISSDGNLLIAGETTLATSTILNLSFGDATSSEYAIMGPNTVFGIYKDGHFKFEGDGLLGASSSSVIQMAGELQVGPLLSPYTVIDNNITTSGNINVTGDYMISGNILIDSSVNMMNSNSVYGFNTGTMLGGGSGNAFFGNSAGNADTFGSNNAFFGVWAGHNNDTGSHNVFNGYGAGSYNTSGRYNVAIGTDAMDRNTTGNSNVAIGYKSGSGSGATSERTGNVLIGNMAGYEQDVSNRLFITNSSSSPDSTLIYGEFDNDILSFNANVGIGTTTPQYKLDVNGNINIASGSSLKIDGADALRMDVNRNNIFIGALSGDLTTGSLNTFLGDRSGEDNTSGWYNTFLGANAGRNNISGTDNTFVGQGVGYNSLTGSYNTLIGNMSGNSLTSGNGNVYIGNSAGGSENESYKYYVSTNDGMSSYDLLYGDFVNGALYLGGTNASNNPSLSLDSNGNIGIGTGTSTPDANLQIYGGDAATSTVEIGGSASSEGACLKLRDSDGAGWTYCTTLDGSLSCSTISCE